MPLKMSFSDRVGTYLTVRWILSFMIPPPLASSLFPGSTMDINTVRGYDLTEYLPISLHYQLSNLSITKGVKDPLFLSFLIVNFLTISLTLLLSLRPGGEVTLWKYYQPNGKIYILFYSNPMDPGLNISKGKRSALYLRYAPKKEINL